MTGRIFIIFLITLIIISCFALCVRAENEYIYTDDKQTIEASDFYKWPINTMDIETHFSLDSVDTWTYEGKEYKSFKDVITRILIELWVPVNLPISESQKIMDEIIEEKKNEDTDRMFDSLNRIIGD